MSVRPVQQRPIVVAVGRIQEGGQEYTDVYIGIVKRSQNIAVVFATRTMEVGVNDHGIESPFQANASTFPAVFGGKVSVRMGNGTMRSTPCTAPAKTQAMALAWSGYL